MRACAHIAARGVSWETPAPPCAWIAASMVRRAVRAARILADAIAVMDWELVCLDVDGDECCCCCFCWACRSRLAAALRTTRRVASMSMREWAMRVSMTPCSERILPKGLRL